MKFSGWLFLIISWSFIAGLTFFSFWKVLRTSSNNPRAKDKTEA